MIRRPLIERPQWQPPAVKPVPFGLVACAGVFALLLLIGGAASAATLSLRSEVASLSASGAARTISLEVFVELTGISSLPVSAHQVRVTLQTGASALSIPAAGAPQRHLYAGPSIAPIVMISEPRVDSGDISFVGAANLTSGAGLLRIDIAIPPGAPAGLYPLVISPDQQFTFIADAAGNPVPIQIASGGFRITSRQGDYDFDNDVDAADYLVWKREFGSAGLFAADGNSNGVVDAADYVVWRDSRAAVTTALGDFDGNGTVYATDYMVWRNTSGQSGMDFAADSTGPAGVPDGLVDALDHELWRAHLGQIATGSGAGITDPAIDAVPEQTTGIMFILGMTVVFASPRAVSSTHPFVRRAEIGPF